MWRGGKGSELVSGAIRLTEVVTAGARLVPVDVGGRGGMEMKKNRICEVERCVSTLYMLCHTIAQASFLLGCLQHKESGMRRIELQCVHRCAREGVERLS